MNKVELTKNILKAVVGTSVSFTVANVLHYNTPANTRVQRAERYVGAVACGMVAASATDKYIDETVDKVVDWWKEATN